MKKTDNSYKEKEGNVKIQRAVRRNQNAGTARISLSDSHTPYVPEHYTQ